MGPKIGYLSNAEKCWLIVNEEEQSEPWWTTCKQLKALRSASLDCGKQFTMQHHDLAAQLREEY